MKKKTSLVSEPKFVFEEKLYRVQTKTAFGCGSVDTVCHSVEVNVCFGNFENKKLVKSIM